MKVSALGLAYVMVPGIVAENKAPADKWSFVGGGDENIVTAAASWSGVSGGQGNRVSSSWSHVTGGSANQVDDTSSWSFVGGGKSNKITTTSPYSSIVGGEENFVVQEADHSFIGGGKVNFVKSDYSSITGGAQNSAFSNYAFIGGGYANVATGKFSSVLGGAQNSVFGRWGVAMGYQGSVGTRATPADLTGVIALSGKRCIEEKPNSLKVCAQNIDFETTTFTMNGESLLPTQRRLAESEVKFSELAAQVQLLTEQVAILTAKM